MRKQFLCNIKSSGSDLTDEKIRKISDDIDRLLASSKIFVRESSHTRNTTVMQDKKAKHEFEISITGYFKIDENNSYDEATIKAKAINDEISRLILSLSEKTESVLEISDIIEDGDMLSAKDMTGEKTGSDNLIILGDEKDGYKVYVSDSPKYKDALAVIYGTKGLEEFFRLSAKLTLSDNDISVQKLINLETKISKLSDEIKRSGVAMIILTGHTAADFYALIDKNNIRTIPRGKMKSEDNIPPIHAPEGDFIIRLVKWNDGIFCVTGDNNEQVRSMFIRRE